MKRKKLEAEVRALNDALNEVAYTANQRITNLEQAATEADTWAGDVNTRIRALEQVQDERRAYPDGQPAGIVSPHVKANLDALASWCVAESQRLPGYATGTEKLLTDLHARILVAMAGGDVEPPLP